VSMITTSFFSQSLCNSSAVMRFALSAGVAAPGIGVVFPCGGAVLFCVSNVSFELQAVNTPAAREIASVTVMNKRILDAPLITLIAETNLQAMLRKAKPFQPQPEDFTILN